MVWVSCGNMAGVLSRKIISAVLGLAVELEDVQLVETAAERLEAAKVRVFERVVSRSGLFAFEIVVKEGDIGARDTNIAGASIDHIAIEPPDFQIPALF